LRCGAWSGDRGEGRESGVSEARGFWR
jgi:hypothetical protein